MTTPPVPQRRTRQRTAVADVLSEVRGFRSAQDIHDLLRERGEKVGLATVYRALQALAEAGEADVIRTPDGQHAYAACGQASHHHHHLICRSCGRTVEVALPSIEKLVGGIAAQHSFTKLDHELEFYGICAECA